MLIFLSEKMEKFPLFMQLYIAKVPVGSRAGENSPGPTQKIRIRHPGSMVVMRQMRFPDPLESSLKTFCLENLFQDCRFCSCLTGARSSKSELKKWNPGPAFKKTISLELIQTCEKIKYQSDFFIPIFLC